VQPSFYFAATNQCHSNALSAEETVKNRCSWLSLIINCTLLAAGTALAFAIIVAGASVALAGHQQAMAEEAQAGTSQEAAPLTETPRVGSTFSGMITDSHCGARHMRNSRQNSIDCAHACVRKGATYVLVDGDRRYTLLGNELVVAKLAGERANITGTRQGDTIIVDAAAPVF
jgi:hypothetical protein